MMGSLNEEQKRQTFVLKTAFLIAKSKRPYVEGEVMIKPSLQNFVELFEGESFHRKVKTAADSVTLSDTTNRPKRVLPWMNQLTILRSHSLALYGRYISPRENLKEELLEVLTLETTTKGQDIFDIVSRFFALSGIEWGSISECNIDGAPAMIGDMNGFKGRVKRVNPDMKFNHSIIHRQALASKDLSVEFENVMVIIINVINFVKARDLNARLFKKICEENDAEYETLRFHNTVRWLSRGRALKRVFLLREELYQFLTEKGHINATKFNDPHFLAKLAFLTGVFTHMNFLNTNLQGRGKFVFELHNSIRGFINKLGVLREEAIQDNFIHFECFLELICFLNDDDIDLTPEVRILCDYLQKLATNFQERFPGLEVKDFTIIQAPFTGKPREEFAMELSQLQANPIAKLEFDSDLSKFWLSLSEEQYPELKSIAQKSQGSIQYALKEIDPFEAIVAQSLRRRSNNTDWRQQKLAVLLLFPAACLPHEAV
ncbi:zinc finger BED domain-containing 5-like [Paramuricea clavata]|uniref:Zinc finger BED domain-containing 5-like n=1 Tax=Paramuricea clavata TaxID=317549 RepID=A0A7D9LJL8_PARCT|nr:zinc finger BED domain-containing 5-like [Paramuricea clavata]